MPREVIRSRQNAHVKALRHAFANNGIFAPNASSAATRIAIEGPHLIDEAIRSGLAVEQLFLREDSASNFAHIPAPSAETHILDRDVFNSAAGTESPQGIAAVIATPARDHADIFSATNALILIADQLQDPGNMGTLIRSAEAFSATVLITLPQTVSPWNAKSVRASAGSVFRLPIILLSLSDLVTQLAQHHIALFATAANAELDLPQADLRQSCAIVIGNEGAGLSPEILAAASANIHIPCTGPVESLNAAVAASIILYEVARQRAHRAEP
jgi:TrmH family RNA methyltransferase